MAERPSYPSSVGEKLANMALAYGLTPSASVARRRLPDAAQIVILEHALELSQRRVRELSRDPLTGTWGRQRLSQILTTEIMRARRFGRPAGVLMVDVDGLKAVNDQHGHPAGDEALAAVARALRGALRGADSVVRYGGDEFCVVVDDARGAALHRLADRIVRTVRQSCAPLGRELRCPITVSVGAAHVWDETTPEQAIRDADRAAYTVKRSGRDAYLVHR